MMSNFKFATTFVVSVRREIRKLRKDRHDMGWKRLVETAILPRLGIVTVSNKACNSFPVELENVYNTHVEFDIVVY